MKFKPLFLFFGLIVSLQAFAQKSNTIEVSGDVLTPFVITMDQIQAMKSMELGDFEITNHAGEPRGTATRLKGFPIVDLLEDVKFNSPSPRQLSEFYLVFEANDGYKVVFSWNELFNNPLGKQVFLITSKDGEDLEEMEDGLLLISKTDIRTGRRHVKNLSKILIKRIQ
jgi:hypothetical protein